MRDWLRRNAELARRTLDAMRPLLLEARSIGLSGHTDRVGAPAFNRKLAARRFDLVLLERLVGEHLVAGDSGLRGQLIWQEPALERIPLVVGFSAPQAGQPGWAAIFERGLRELHASGE